MFKMILNVGFYLIPFSQKKNSNALWIPGLPDGIFFNQKSKFGLVLEGLRIENVSIFYDHLEYKTAFCIFYGHLVI
jgi:hypothetical protein